MFWEQLGNAKTSVGRNKVKLLSENSRIESGVNVELQGVIESPTSEEQSVEEGRRTENRIVVGREKGESTVDRNIAFSEIV